MDDIVDAKAVKKAKRPFLPPDFVRAMLAGHSALGLAFAALIYVVCLTGTIAVFASELQRWERPIGPTIAGEVSPEAVGAAVQNGYKQAVAEHAAHDLFLLGPGLAGARLLVHYRDHESGAEGSWVASAEGRLIRRVDAPWSELVAHLHTNLHLPRTWGMFLVGLTGVALLSSLVSGLLAHPRIFKDAFALRWGGSKRLQDADLHNRLSVWGLPFHITVTLTGALLGLSILIVGVLALAAYEGNSEKAFATLLGPMPGADKSPAPVPDVASMIRRVQRERPSATFVNAGIQHIGTVGQVVHLGMRTPGHLAFSNTYYFDGSGKPLGDGGLETGSIGQQILGALSPLHFGWFGGMPVKIAYAILGLALTVVTHTGVAIWIARRGDKGRPVPGWAKAWAAVAFGQPLALAVAAGAALTASEHLVLAGYLVASVASFALAGAMASAAMATRVLCILCAAVLVTVVATHAAIWVQQATDAVAWAVSAVMLGTAFTFAARASSR